MQQINTNAYTLAINALQAETAMTPNALRYIATATLRKWLEDDASRLAAALAFYSALSLGPLLLIVIAIGGLAFGQEAASGHVFAEIRGLVGNEGAEAIQTALAHSRNQATGFWATLIGVVTLMIAALGVFGQLQDALNIIWHAKRRPRNFWWMIEKRVLSFAMILSIGFLLLTSLIVSAVLSAIGAYFTGLLPTVALQLANMIISFSVITVLFAMIFRILPDVYIEWREVWVGAAITALLFSFGKLLIGMYLGHSALGSTYGAAGSLMVVLIWIYYSAQILFLGAEFTRVYADYITARAAPRPPEP